MILGGIQQEKLVHFPGYYMQSIMALADIFLDSSQSIYL
jgi:hypothetical protein